LIAKLLKYILKRKCFAKNIKRTWLMLMYKEGQESYLLVVDSTGNEKESIEFIGDNEYRNIIKNN